MQRIMKAQVLRDASMFSFMVGKKKMEINPEHFIMQSLEKKFSADASSTTIKDLIWLLYETTALTSGFSLDVTVSLTLIFVSKPGKTTFFFFFEDSPSPPICNESTKI